MDNNNEIGLIEKLFINFELDAWANILEVVGFCITIISLVVALIVKSEISNLKMSYVFDKRIKEHIKELTSQASIINDLLNDFTSNREEIKKTLNITKAELSDLNKKLGVWESLKISLLIFFIWNRLQRNFYGKENIKMNDFISFFLIRPIRFFVTTKNDIYITYARLHGVIRFVENIKKNKKNSL